MKRRHRQSAVDSIISIYENPHAHSKKFSKQLKKLEPISHKSSSNSNWTPIVNASQLLKQKQQIPKPTEKKIGMNSLQSTVKYPLTMNEIKNKVLENKIKDAVTANKIQNSSLGSNIEDALAINKMQNDSLVNDIDEAIEEQEIQTSIVDDIAHTIRNQNYSIIDNLPYALSQQEFKRSSIIDDMSFRINRSEVQHKYLDKCFFEDKPSGSGIKSKSDFAKSNTDCAMNSSKPQESADDWSFKKGVDDGSFVAMSIDFALDQSKTLDHFFATGVMDHLFTDIDKKLSDP